MDRCGGVPGMNPEEIVLCSPVRTAIGAYGGILKDTPAPMLGAAALREVIRRSGLAPDLVDSVVMGNVIQAGVGMNPARQAAVAAGIPVAVPALTVNRACGSGAQAIASAATDIRAGLIDCALAGGMENMDRAPYLLPEGRWGARMGDVTLCDAMLRDGLHDAFSGRHAGWHADALAQQLGISRGEQDRWALRSQRHFAEAQAAGRFDAEIVPVEAATRKGPVTVARDEQNRPDPSSDLLGGLKPAFRKDGTITAGNAPGLNSGAAAVLVARRGWADSNRLAPMARLAGFGIAALEPGMFGLGAVPAVRQALLRADWSLASVDRVEINEAFAAIALACMRELAFPEDIVNVDGGALAHGHPIGATGALLATRLMNAMRRDGLRRGIVTLCIGDGQGIALAIERM